MKSLSARPKMLAVLYSIIVILFLHHLISKTTLLTGTNSQTDDLREKVLNEISLKTTIQGDILDCKKKNISSANKPGVDGVIAHPEAYSWLVGYYDNKYGSYGLKGKLEEFLYMKGDNNKGATVTLTTDSRIQLKAYQLIQNMTGSLIVLNAKTGEILALASSNKDKAFNANKLSEYMNTYNKIPGFFLAKGLQEGEAPGSTFKIVTAAAMIETGMDTSLYNDNGEISLGAKKISNYKNKAYGKIGLEKALGYSSNVYFAYNAVMLGGIALEKKSRDFLLGEKIELDFATITSSIDMEDYSEAIVASTGFGQGKIKIAPIHLAMIAQAIANNGEMLKPYMIKDITLDGRVLYTGNAETLKNAITSDTANKLKEILGVVASEYYGMKTPGICAKSGTADLGNGSNHSYILSFNNDYVVVASQNDTTNMGSNLIPIVDALYSVLSSEQ